MKIYNYRSMIWLFFLTYTVTACSQPHNTDIQDKTSPVSVQEQSDKPQLTWTELRSGLWQSNQGDFGLQVSIFHEETMDSTTDYLTHLGTKDGDVKTFKEFIDVESFQRLDDSNYYQDKNHIYRFVGMAGGGTFSVLDEVDYESFVVLNYCFAKDNHTIFHWRGMGENYDYDSFQLCSDARCIAKDKNHVYTVC